VKVSEISGVSRERFGTWVLVPLQGVAAGCPSRFAGCSVRFGAC